MRKTAKISFIVFFLTAGLLLAGSFAYAQVDVGSNFVSGTGLANVDPRVIIGRVIQIFLGFLGIIALGLIMYGGFLWMTSSGDESRVEKAKDVLRNSIIGLVIILSAFGITTFLLNKIMGATGNIYGSTPGGSRGIGGSGVLGVCSVESVYPTPDQREVPRNTSVIVTFKDEVDSATICNDSNSDGRCNGENILTDGSIGIYKSGDDPSTFLTDVRVYDTADHKTFVFVPGSYLGSPSEYIWYTVHISSDVSKPDGRSIFESCSVDYLEWQFEVSNIKIDLTPPQVKSGGVFPPPDNGRDSISLLSSPVQAAGTVTVDAQPHVYSKARVTAVSPSGTTPTATAVAEDDCSEGGTLTVTVSTDGLTAQVSNGARLLGSAVFSGRSVVFPNMFTLESSADPAPGNSWNVAVTAAVQADTLTVGRMVYVFVSSAVAPNQIQLGSGVNQTASNIAATINAHADVDASAAGNIVSIKATLAGTSGNNIVLATSNGSALDLSGSSLTGGSSRQESSIVSGRRDQPMNTVIQINFNEAIMPTMVAGDAASVRDRIRVVNAKPGAAPAGGACSIDADCLSFDCQAGVCVGANDYLPGKFKISNQYQTVEFISDNQCGVNGCGEPIFCLPANSQLRVVLTPASLTPCSSGTDCASKSPYNTCSTQPQSGALQLCRQDLGGNYAGSKTRNYPVADVGAMDGIMDTSMNSLDGDRNNFADGPIATYSDNPPIYSSNAQCQADFERIIAAIKNKRIEQDKVLGQVTGSFCSSCSCSTPASCQTTMDTAMRALGFSGAIKDYGGAFFIFDENEDEGTYGACRKDGLSSLNCGSVSVPFYFCANGDIYSWTFFISDKMEVSAPVLESVIPNRGASVSPGGEISGRFNKMMMSSSLMTGQTKVVNGDNTVIHKNLNIWSLAGRAVGYWIESEGVDTNSDGEMDKTMVYIDHNLFDNSVSYRAQMGSGIKDIYQNCYKPSDGPNCSGVNESNPSCCNGSAANDLDQKGNCR